MSKLPPDELTWLYGHCKAIGMDCKSDSGKWEHDIALFTINQKDRIAQLEQELSDTKTLVRIYQGAITPADGEGDLEDQVANLKVRNAELERSNKELRDALEKARKLTDSQAQAVAFYGDQPEFELELLAMLDAALSAAVGK